MKMMRARRWGGPSGARRPESCSKAARRCLRVSAPPESERCKGHPRQRRPSQTHIFDRSPDANPRVRRPVDESKPISRDLSSQSATSPPHGTRRSDAHCTLHKRSGSRRPVSPGYGGTFRGGKSSCSTAACSLACTSSRRRSEPRRELRSGSSPLRCRLATSTHRHQLLRIKHEKGRAYPEPPSLR